MSIKMVLFDLDGTLLPMNQELFLKAYFKGLVSAMLPHGYEPTELIGAINKGTVSMVTNQGEKTNEEAFWEAVTSVYGDRILKDSVYFDEFYLSPDGFDAVRSVLGYTEKSRETVDLIKGLGIRIALATNPAFPSIATEKRIAWAGLEPSDFELYTTYENSHFCKPNLAYYKEIIEKLGVSAEDCLMVGNDVGDDMVAESLGMKVFLLTDCLINKTEKSPSDYPNGSFDELIRFIKENM